jgi:peptidoglycan/xylan/chitin deacetylase (PgdA/CDA1 family)
MRRTPLIVCYHAVSATWDSSLAVTPRTLERQLALLAGRGYVGRTLEASERERRDGTLPERCVVVTFDDGFASVLAARPVLDRLGLPATVFVLPPFVDSGARLRWPEIEQWLERAPSELAPLGWDQLDELVERGWEIGAHTLAHPHLPRIPDARLHEELRAPREVLEARYGSCESVAYPFGEADERVAAAAAAAGYSVGVTLTVATRVDEPLRRPRVGLYGNDLGWRLRAKLAPTTRWARRHLPEGVAAHLVRGAARARGRLGR